MKKILCVALAALMLFCFTACSGGKGGENLKGDLKNGSGDTVKSTEAFSLGVTEGSTYENKYLGLGLKIPDGWSFYDDEKIAELNGIVTEHMDEDMVDAMKEAEYFYDLYAVSADEQESVNIIFEKSTISQIATLDLEEYAETVVEGVEETYASMGFTVLEKDIDEIEIDGKDYTAYFLKSDMQGRTVYQAGFSVKKTNYIVSIAMAATSEDGLKELVDAFYHL